MSVQDFLEEAKKRGNGESLSLAQQEIADFANLIYDGIRGGSTKLWVREAATLFIRNIAPELPASDVKMSAVVIEGIVLTVLAEMFSEGTLLKKEVMDKE